MRVVRTQTDCDVTGFVSYEAVEYNSCSSSSHNKSQSKFYFPPPKKKTIANLPLWGITHLLPPFFQLFMPQRIASLNS
jgi:hypothetical protein